MRKERLLILPLAAVVVALGAGPAAAAEGDGFGFIEASLLLLLGMFLGAVGAYILGTRKISIFRDVIASVPRPRQVVGPGGEVFYATPAFRDLFGDDQRPTLEYLSEQAADQEALDQIDRLARNAGNGIPGYAEIRVHALKRIGGARASSRLKFDDEFEWCYVAAYPVKNWPGYVLWFVDDVKPRRQMEQVVRDEQQRFVDLLRHTEVGFYSVDAEGRFVTANEAFADWLGVSLKDLQSGQILLHEIVARKMPAGTLPSDPFGAGIEQGDVVLRNSDGIEFEAFIGQNVERDPEGWVLRTQSVVRNLSRERSMAEALVSAERRFDSFFERAPVGIAVVDSKGMVKECNKVARDMAGVSGELPDKLSLIDLVSEPSQPLVEDMLQRAALAEGTEAASVPIEVKLAGEGEMACALFITRMEQEVERSSGFVAHFIDTTEQKTLELQFVQSQKMQAVGQLAGGIAHDFNNLLTAMIGFSDLLLLRHRPGDQSFADIMQIKQNANRAANLVRQLLAFSRQQTLQSKVLDVTDILAELSHLLRRLIGENIELKMVHGRDLGTVKSDQGQLEQVIINLAVNARDAMPEGGTLTIRTDNVSLSRVTKRDGETVPAGDYTRIETMDSGCGVAQENLDRIFDPFFTTKEVGAGTGLGLSTVYGIVKQTGGFIFVDSELGKGTSFTILLPHHAETAIEAAERETAVEPNRDLSGIGTLLLVEDEDAVRAFSARALRNKGYNVLEARSGEAALELLSEQVEPIDLLITDVVMPRIDGPTLVREVRGERPDLKVIFISGYAEDAFRKRLDQDAGIHFLPKPFSLKQLAGKVKEVMHETAA